MSRHNFAREGILTPLKRTIEVGAIQWEEGAELPVLWQNIADVNSIMGKATDFYRADDGWISAEITWQPKHQDLIDHDLGKAFFLSIYANNLVSERVEGGEIVKSCRLKSIIAVLSDPWSEKD